MADNSQARQPGQSSGCVSSAHDPRPEPPDQDTRLRITDDLEGSFLVEAGAGSGKTKSLVDRMVALVCQDACKVEEVAAVTFTRKAAAELRQRFQVELERAAQWPNLDDAQRNRIRDALQNLDRAFLGTIHSFCAKLLRERPLEAGLDPGFREVAETEAIRLQKKFWVEYLERLAADGDPRLKELADVGMKPAQLEQLFAELVKNPDVDFGSERVPPPDEVEVGRVRAELDALLNRASALLPDKAPEDGWDSLAKRVRTLLYQRCSFGWDDRLAFFDALTNLYDFTASLTQKRWSSDPAVKAQVKQLGQDFREFGDPAGPVGKVVRAWWAYRYPIAVGFAKGAARSFAEERKDLGLVTFQDDLMLAAALLRKNSATRRDLGGRYRRLLVDEFQDTDPLQAEIVFLLASDPSTGNDWARVRPRPGALFVVGDPKQSIYRFRRADIALYDFVKRRFEEFGEVLRLEANFRSLKCIERVVKGVFDSEEMLPARDQRKQAAFAPLRVQRGRATGDGPGVIRSYAVTGRNQGEAVEDDARFVAAHVNEQVTQGCRKAGDFMILTRNRHHLALYARVLEEWNLPVEVSGAGVEFEDKLAAFLLLFRCMADPAHPVHVLGVLTGPFFGISLDEILAYRDAGGQLAANQRPWLQEDAGQGHHIDGVVQALDVLHGWWRLARREPADVTAERLATATGIFPLAAAGPLGQLRAGALVYLLDAVRAQALEGNASLTGAVEAMETALEWRDAVVSLVPGQGNAVRVMNLHQAKGLEAPVVFLGSPFGEKAGNPTMRVVRGDDGVARGVMRVGEPGQYNRTKVIAQPETWEEDKKIETEFEEAEKTRLLYVAATRAMDELWVARWSDAPRSNKSPWAPVEEWITQEARREASDAGDGTGEGQVAARVDYVARPASPGSEVLDAETDLGAAVEKAESAVAGAGTPSYRLTTATGEARGEPSDDDKDAPVGVGPLAADVTDTDALAGSVAGSEHDHRDDRVDRSPDTDTAAPDLDLRPTPSRSRRPALGGFEWGKIVHEMLSAIEEGEAAEVLKARARNLLVHHDRPQDAHGNPKEIARLLEHVDAVTNSEVWARAIGSPERYTEMPFAVRRPSRLDGPPVVREGVIDLVFREDGGWVVADYKTDSGKDPGFADRVPEYKRQVDIYAECWEEITGDAVVERMLVFTAQKRAESW